MRRFVILLIALFSFVGQAHAFLGAECEIHWQAYVLSAQHGADEAALADPSDALYPSFADPAPAAEGKRLLLALTIVPPQGQYLYGPESTDGLPTELAVRVAQLSAYPMQRLSSVQIASLTQEKGEALPVRAPRAILKKETEYASVELPGSEGSNPPIYPGPVTFWAELPFAQGLGGIAAEVSLSGLLCSPVSCSPAGGSLALSFSAAEMAQFPPAQEQDWWLAWQEGENVLVPPPDSAFVATAPTGANPFAGGKSLTPKAPQNSEAPLDSAGELARHSAFFSTLEPSFFNPDTEVQFLGEALLFGLLAGLLLNLMPCVLPVVSLKFSALLAVSAMTDRQQQARAFRAHCIIFALGIMAWFMVLAVLLGVAGWAWGELFQRPIVIVLLGLMLFVLALSLFGVYSLPIFDLRIGRDSKHPHWQAFASGLLATLLATPCSGPLLGGVLAWAIRQPLPVLFLCVISVGLGMSLPYYILAFCPRLVHLLPRPGTWTLRLEQLLGFFLVGSVVYLATLLPAEWLPAFLFSLFSVAFAAWLWGQIGHLRASALRRFLARGTAVGILVLAALFGASSVNPDRAWEAFDPQQFADLLGKEPMLLDFTADWCPSCKALEHTTLNKNRMEDLRRKYNVRTIRVDITRNAEAGKELLRALDSTSIPVLALFPKGEGAKQPIVLRDLVTPGQLDEAVLATYAGKGVERFRRMLSESSLSLGPSFLFEGPSCPIFPSPLPH